MFQLAYLLPNCKTMKKQLWNQHLNLGKTQLRSNPVIYGTNLNLSVSFVELFQLPQ